MYDIYSLVFPHVYIYTMYIVCWWFYALYFYIDCVTSCLLVHVYIISVVYWLCKHFCCILDYVI